MIAAGCRCANVPEVVVDVRVGDGMYSRRANMAYLRSQIEFFSTLRRLGLVSHVDWVRAVVERTLATVLPSHLVRVAYNSLLRGRAK